MGNSSFVKTLLLFWAFFLFSRIEVMAISPEQLFEHRLLAPISSESEKRQFARRVAPLIDGKIKARKNTRLVSFLVKQSRLVAPESRLDVLERFCSLQEVYTKHNPYIPFPLEVAFLLSTHMNFRFEFTEKNIDEPFNLLKGLTFSESEEILRLSSDIMGLITKNDWFEFYGVIEGVRYCAGKNRLDVITTIKHFILPGMDSIALGFLFPQILVNSETQNQEALSWVRQFIPSETNGAVIVDFTQRLEAIESSQRRESFPRVLQLVSQDMEVWKMTHVIESFSKLPVAVMDKVLGRAIEVLGPGNRMENTYLLTVANTIPDNLWNNVLLWARKCCTHNPTLLQNVPLLLQELSLLAEEFWPVSPYAEDLNVLSYISSLLKTPLGSEAPHYLLHYLTQCIEKNRRISRDHLLKYRPYSYSFG